MIFYVYTKPCFMVQCSIDILKTLNLLGSIVTRGSDCETCCIVVIPLLQEKSAITIKDCESSKGVSYHLLLIADDNRQQLIHPLVLQGSKKKKPLLIRNKYNFLSAINLLFSLAPWARHFYNYFETGKFFGKWKVFRWNLNI